MSCTVLPNPKSNTDPGVMVFWPRSISSMTETASGVMLESMNSAIHANSTRGTDSLVGRDRVHRRTIYVHIHMLIYINAYIHKCFSR